jgi:tetratricopeptide (TPR) repeat protein
MPKTKGADSRNDNVKAVPTGNLNRLDCGISQIRFPDSLTVEKSIKSLAPPDSIYLNAAEGWLELGNHIEANEELDNITPELRVHPDVLEIRWQIYAQESKWEACRDIARTITQIEPGRPSGWIHYAYATRRAPNGSLKAAQEILLPAVDKFPSVYIIPYNLACYDCQLGNLKAALQWIEKAIDLAGKTDIRLMALNDLDLEPLWNDISEI